MSALDTETVPARRALRAEGIVLVGTGVVVAFGLLVVLGEADYLAFHSVIEFLVASVSLAIFFIAWHTRHVVDDDFITVLGIAQLFVAITTILHALTYKGMPVFPNTTVTMSSQLWIVTRALQAAGLLLAPLFIGRRLRRPGLVVVAFAFPVMAASAAVFLGVFPVTFVDGMGLTSFKVYAELAIMAGMALGLFMLWRKRDRFAPRVFTDLALATVCMIAAETLFSIYSNLFDIYNVTGHILHLASVYFIYQALVARSLEDPFALLFRTLAQREDALREQYRLSDGLNRVATSITASLKVDDIMGTAMVEARGVAGADGAAVSLHEGDGRFRVRYVDGESLRSFAGLVLDRAEAPHLFMAMETGEPVVIADTEIDHRADRTAARVGTRSLLSIPLIAGGETLGVMSLHWLAPSPAVTSPRLLVFASKLGASLSLALANAHLYEGEHRVAETLQNAMAASLETTELVELGSVYQAAPGVGRVGGDFFDVFSLPDQRVAFVLGDVCGKGIEAAATSALARSTIRALAYRDPDPASVLHGANEALRLQLPDGEFVTAAYGLLDPTGDEVAVGLAGHPEPMVCGRADLVPDIEMRSPPLAVVGGATFAVWRFSLRPGEALVLFSDGISEARRGAEQFGMERIRRALDSCGDDSCQSIVDGLLAAVDRFAEGGLRDDAAALALRVTRER